MRLIDLEYTARPFLGYRKMVLHLREQGHPVNKKRVARLMQLMGLAAMVPGPNTSRPGSAEPGLSVSAARCGDRADQSGLEL